MKNKSYILSAIIIFGLSGLVSAQEPPRPHHPPKFDKKWFNHVDANKNGTIDLEEFRADENKKFADTDKNNDGVIDESEMPEPHGRGEGAPPPRGRDERRMPPPNGSDFGGRNGMQPPRGEKREGNAPMMPPPPFFEVSDSNKDGKITRAEFDEGVNKQFTLIDKNADGGISLEEAKAVKGRDDREHGDRPPPNSPMVAFLGAEMRFGDKLVKNAPFSAETVMENSRRLFDGSTITKQSKGAIYRDGAGRTRREQPLENIGSFSVGEAQKLIFINDPIEGKQYFLDANRKTFRRLEMRGNQSAPPKFDEENRDAKTESLGTKIINGISAEGTRTTVEIPAGQIGNEKAIQIISERWYSPELQTVIMSRHLDPLSGEQVFRLENIKRAEPTKEMFVVPADFKADSNKP